MTDEKLWDKTTEIFNRTQGAMDLDGIASIFASCVLGVKDDEGIVFTTQKDFGKRYVFTPIERDGNVIGQVTDESTGEVLQEWNLSCPQLIYHKEV